MNALTKFSGVEASVFLNLVVNPCNVNVCEGVVRFDLVLPGCNYLVYLVGEITPKLKEVTISVGCENPENDYDVSFNTYHIEHKEFDNFTLAKVIDFDEVVAIKGMPFMLTYDQIEQLNEALLEQAKEKNGVPA